MMRGPRSTLRQLVLLSLALAAGACKQSDSILYIVVAGPKNLGATQFFVNVSAVPETRSFFIPPTPGDVITLPASFTISLDRSHTAPIIVSIDAHSADNSTVASGTTMQDHINIGGETIIPVMLDENLPPERTGSGGAGGAGGAGGSAGGGGTSGQGGASGMDGSANVAGAGGLDSATD
jgi:uncharacterized membrane protein YgcG